MIFLFGTRGPCCRGPTYSTLPTLPCPPHCYAAGSARSTASRSACCTQRWTLDVMDWRRSSDELMLTTLATVDVPRRDFFSSPEFGTAVSEGSVYSYFGDAEFRSYSVFNKHATRTGCVRELGSFICFYRLVTDRGDSVAEWLAC